MPGFQFSPYQSQHAGSIADLLTLDARARANALRQGTEAQARAAEVSGQAWGGAIHNIGQQVGGALSDVARYREEAPIRAQQTALRGLQLQNARDEQAGRQRAGQVQSQADEILARIDAGEDESLLQGQPAEVQTRVRAFLSESRKYEQDRDALDQAAITRAANEAANFNYDPVISETLFKLVGRKIPQAMQVWESVKDNPEALRATVDKYRGVKPADPVKLGPGDVLVPPTGGAPLARNPRPDTPAPGFELSPGQTRFDASGRRIASLPAAPNQPRVPSFEERIADALGRGDQATVDRLTKAAELAAGARSRTQGRPITSGDTSRITDLRTSLNDLGVLRETLTDTKDATGTRAAVGAALPKAVTDITGWGTTAKQRQGVIDRVKQVIGKALEGGVLRKEDEIKYAKILPTIGDTQAVAMSKLNGLQQAIQQRLETFLGDLSSSGFDTGAHTTRDGQVGGTKKIGRFEVMVE